MTDTIILRFRVGKVGDPSGVRASGAGKHFSITFDPRKVVGIAVQALVRQQLAEFDPYIVASLLPHLPKDAP